MQINCHKVQLVVATCNMQKSSTNFDCRAANEEKEKEREGEREREERGESESGRESESRRNGVNYENANLSVKFCVKGKSCK